jgi:ribonuclease BN (tRNA processing enzyme)
LRAGQFANAATGLSPEKNTLFASLPEYKLGSKPVVGDMMRITFLGTTPLERLTQSCSSVFVELGNGESFVFDCGAGVTIKYTTMQIAYSKMRKIFFTHLHGDHTSDLTHIYCFGPQGDAKSPLYIWGPSASGVQDPVDGTYYDDGTLNFAYHFREMNRWHTESQSFVPTRYTDSEGDGYDIFATELNWRNGDTSRSWTTRPSIPKPPSGQWVAYEANGVRVSYFPAIHGRAGSVSYKLEWKGLSMIFTGDTKPTRPRRNTTPTSNRPRRAWPVTRKSAMQRPIPQPACNANAMPRASMTRPSLRPRPSCRPAGSRLRPNRPAPNAAR